MNRRVSAMMAMALVLTGCATADDPAFYTASIRASGPASSKAMAPALTADVAPDFAIAYLPSVAGGVAGVRQQSRPNAVDQTILYPNAHYGADENRLTISVASPSRNSSYWQAPTMASIQTEIRRTLPGISMRVANGTGENLHGPFGYAIGTSSAEGTCIFAWQTVREIGTTHRKGAFFSATRDVYAAKVRLRYCHNAFDEAGLVSLMSGLRIKEVTGATLEMLRFSEGSGVASHAAPVAMTAPEPEYVAQPQKPRPAVTARAHTPALEEVTVEPAIRAPASLKPQTADGTAVRSATAVRVVLPGELDGYAEAQKAALSAPAAPAKRVAPRTNVAVPLPGDLSR